MAAWAWLAVGLGVAVVVLLLSRFLNRSKTTADLAIRLADAYRAAGQFEVAERLYRVPATLSQNREEAREGLALARQRRRHPAVVEAPLVAAARDALRRDRSVLEARFEKRGVAVELPPLGAGQDEPN